MRLKLKVAAAIIMAANIPSYAYSNEKYKSARDTEVIGLDVDENGVRDDIQNYIRNRYAGLPIIHTLLTRYTIALDQFLIGEDPIAAAAEMDAAKYCSISYGYSGEEFIRLSAQVYQMQINTPARKLAAVKSERYVMFNGGGSYRNKPYKAYCNKVENDSLSKQKACMFNECS